MKGFLVGMAVFLGVLAFIALCIFGFITGNYNTLVAQRVECVTQWGQVETQYQRRFDLIPNLVEATRGYMQHEQIVFKAIAEARKNYAGAKGDAKVAAQGALDGALGRLLVIMENYPNLKANDIVHDLMYELAGTENRINVARQRYNEAVQVYDTSIQSFPGNIFAGFFHFEAKTMYASQQGAEVAPKVSLEVK